MVSEVSDSMFCHHCWVWSTGMVVVPGEAGREGREGERVSGVGVSGVSREEGKERKRDESAGCIY